MRFILASILSVFIIFSASSQGQYFSFSSGPDLPPNSGNAEQPGLAGMYIGLEDGVVIAAGGANFPDKMPWANGVKTYYDDIFILRRNGDKYQWDISDKIPQASAYGGAVETSYGLLCFGGNTVDRTISESWFIDYHPSADAIEIRPGPELPVPLTNFAFAQIDGVVFVAGGSSEVQGQSTKYFFRMDLVGHHPSEWVWEELDSWEGPPRSYAVGVAQSDGATNCFYLFSGRNVQADSQPEILYDGYVFNPFLNKWSTIAMGRNKEFPFTAGSAVALGAATILVTSGDNGDVTEKQSAIENQLASLKSNAADRAIRDSLMDQVVNHLENHPGFGDQLYLFNTVTNQTHSIPLSSKEQVTTTAVRWGDDILVPSGEIRPGVRTPATTRITVLDGNRHLTIADIIVIVLYFVVLAWMGYYFSKRQRNTSDYFLGSGRVPWWAAGLSIFGTSLSSITFMAIPSKTYATDWSYFMLNMTIFFVAPIIVFVVIPFFRRMNITTAYEYLERRFNLTVRLLGAISFILFQIGRMGVVLFLPAIALNVVSEVDIFLCIGLMGAISLIYTMMGGIEAVIWTDVMQVFVLLGGAIISIVLMISAVDGGLASVVEIGGSYDKFTIAVLDFSLRQPTVWVMLIGGMFANITMYTTDQTMVQRYLTTKSISEAKQSVWTNAILAIPATIIFFFIGSCLFVFYRVNPEQLNPTLESNDSIFPWFIASQLPPGVSGFLIAGILAAAMSTLSSSMNSVATSYSTDIHFRFRWNVNADRLTIARIATTVAGVIGTLFALMMATMDIHSLWDQFQKVLGLVIGSLGGVFLLGIVSRQANSTGALVGIGFSIVIQLVVGVYKPVHLLLYAATGFISCFVIGYLASLVFADTDRKFKSYEVVTENSDDGPIKDELNRRD